MKSSVTLAVVAVVAVIAVAAGAVYVFSTSTGTVVMGVTDAPFNSNVTHVYLTISGVAFQGASNNSVTYNLNSTRFDLLALTNVTKFIGSNSIPVGNYTMIRFTVTSAVATISGANVTLTVPSGEVKVPIHFDVKAGKTTSIVLDITADSSINISTSHNFRPVVTVKRVTGPG